MPGLDRTFHALADPTRRAILTRLRSGPATVNELADRFPLTQQAVSKHVAVLRKAGLIHQRPIGRERRCTIKPSPMRQASKWMEAYRFMWDDRFDRLATQLDRTSRR